MSQTPLINGAQSSVPNSVTDFQELSRQIFSKLADMGNAVVPGTGETTHGLGGTEAASRSQLPVLDKPKLVLGGLSMGGLSLETLMDAVGAEQRRTETKTGLSNIKARAQERATANEEKIKQVQEEVDRAKSGNFLEGLIKAFKYIGMVLAAIGSIAMITLGAVGLAAGGAGAALIAVGVASLALLVSSITEEASGGKAGFSPAFIVGKIMEACGASETATMWTKFAVDLATSLVLVVVSLGASAGSTVGKAVETTATVAAKVATTTDKITKAASMVSRAATIAGGVNTIAQGATSVASAVNEKDVAYLQAQRKRLDAILERIANANNLDMDHIKAMMERSEQVLQQVSDIVQEGAVTNTAIMTGSPSMA